MPKERRHVRLFKNGRNQAVRIPRELELPGREAIVYRDGERLVLEPLAGPSLLDLLASWEVIDTDWPEVDDPIPRPVELDGDD
jgi:antitoxin VapB